MLVINVGAVGVVVGVVVVIVGTIHTHGE